MCCQFQNRKMVFLVHYFVLQFHGKRMKSTFTKPAWFLCNLLDWQRCRAQHTGDQKRFIYWTKLCITADPGFGICLRDSGSPLVKCQGQKSTGWNGNYHSMLNGSNNKRISLLSKTTYGNLTLNRKIFPKKNYPWVSMVLSYHFFCQT